MKRKVRQNKVRYRLITFIVITVLLCQSMAWADGESLLAPKSAFPTQSPPAKQLVSGPPSLPIIILAVFFSVFLAVKSAFGDVPHTPRIPTTMEDVVATKKLPPEEKLDIAWRIIRDIERDIDQKYRNRIPVRFVPGVKGVADTNAIESYLDGEPVVIKISRDWLDGNDPKSAVYLARILRGQLQYIIETEGATNVFKWWWAIHKVLWGEGKERAWEEEEKLIKEYDEKYGIELDRRLYRKHRLSMEVMFSLKYTWWKVNLFFVDLFIFVSILLGMRFIFLRKIFRNRERKIPIRRTGFGVTHYDQGWREHGSDRANRGTALLEVLIGVIFISIVSSVCIIKPDWVFWIAVSLGMAGIAFTGGGTEAGDDKTATVKRKIANALGEWKQHPHTSYRQLVLDIYYLLRYTFLNSGSNVQFNPELEGLPSMAEYLKGTPLEEIAGKLQGQLAEKGSHWLAARGVVREMLNLAGDILKKRLSKEAEKELIGKLCEEIREGLFTPLDDYVEQPGREGIFAKLLKEDYPRLKQKVKELNIRLAEEGELLRVSLNIDHDGTYFDLADGVDLQLFLRTDPHIVYDIHSDSFRIGSRLNETNWLTYSKRDELFCEYELIQDIDDRIKRGKTVATVSVCFDYFSDYHKEPRVKPTPEAIKRKVDKIVEDLINNDIDVRLFSMAVSPYYIFAEQSELIIDELIEGIKRYTMRRKQSGWYRKQLRELFPLPSAEKDTYVDRFVKAALHTEAPSGVKAMDDSEFYQRLYYALEKPSFGLGLPGRLAPSNIWWTHIVGNLIMGTGIRGDEKISDLREVGLFKKETAELLMEYIRRNREIFGRAGVRSGVRGFKGYLRSDIEGLGFKDTDPSKDELESKPRAEMQIIQWEDRIAFASGFRENIRRIEGVRPGDSGEIERIINRCIKRRLELFDKDKNILHRVLSNLPEKKMFLYFVDGSKGLFGDHAKNGKAWVNIIALSYLINNLGIDEGIKAKILGIVLGIGLSHEILGHEAGIDDDETLTYQDAIVTMEILREEGIKFGFSYYIDLLNRILQDRSPYIKQLRAIENLADPDSRKTATDSGTIELPLPVSVIWGDEEREDRFVPAEIVDGVISNITLGLLERLDTEGKYGIYSYDKKDGTKEIGSFSIIHKEGVGPPTSYIQFSFNKEYAYLMLSGREVMGGLASAISKRMKLDVRRVRVLVSKMLVEIEPIEMDGWMVLVPVVNNILEKSVELEALGDFMLKEGDGERKLRLKGVFSDDAERKVDVHYLQTEDFSVEMVKIEGLDAEWIKGFLRGGLDALWKIVSFQVEGRRSQILERNLDTARRMLYQEISGIVFIPAHLSEGVEFDISITKDGDKKVLVVFVNKEIREMDVNRLLYAFLMFFIDSNIGRTAVKSKWINRTLARATSGEEPESAGGLVWREILKRGDKDEMGYTTKVFPNGLKIELDRDGEIRRAWLVNDAISPLLLVRKLQKSEGNISLPKRLDYEKKVVSPSGEEKRFKIARFMLNDVRFRLAAHGAIANMILGKFDWWQGLDIIYNLPGRLPYIEGFKRWLSGFDLIGFDLVIGKEGQDIHVYEEINKDLREEGDSRHLIIRIPQARQKSIRQESLIVYILFYYYYTLGRRDLINTNVEELVGRCISLSKKVRSMSVDTGTGLTVNVDANGYINVKYGDVYIPLILIGKMASGFRRFILSLSKVNAWMQKQKSATPGRLDREISASV